MAQAPTPKEIVVVFTGDAAGLKKSIDEIDRELSQLVVQTDRAQAALGPGMAKATKTLEKRFVTASKGINQYTAAQNRAMKTSGQMRGQMQNLGYQFQDTIVQLEMGTEWTRVLAQQGSQAAGAFGLWGVAIGGFLAVFGMVWPMISRTSKEVELNTKVFDEAASSIDTYASAMDNLAAIQSGESAAGFKTTSEGVERFAKSSAEIARNFATADIQNAIDSRMEENEAAAELLDSIGKLEALRVQTEREMIGGMGSQFGTDVYIQRLKSSEAAMADLKSQLDNMAGAAGLAEGAFAGLVQIQKGIANSDGGLEAQSRLAQSALDHVVATGAAQGENREETLANYEAHKNLVGVLQKQVEVLLRQRDIQGELTAAAAANEYSTWTFSELITPESVAVAKQFRSENELMAQAVESSASDLAKAVANYEKLVAQQDESKDLVEDIMDAMMTFKDDAATAATDMGLIAGWSSGIATNLWSAAVAFEKMRQGLPPGEGKVYSGRGGNAQWDNQQRQNSYLQQIQDAENYGNGVRTRTSSGGGGSTSADENKIRDLMEEYRLKKQILTLDESRAVVIKALGLDVTKYNQAQIDGAEAVIEAYRKQRDALERQQDAWETVSSGLEDGFMSMIEGAESFEDAMKNMAKSVVNELFRILVLQRLIGSAGGGGTAASGIVGWASGLFANAKGNAFSGGAVVPFAQGGVVGGPTVFPMSNGSTGLMGEAGPEAIMPLQRTASGDLGVAGPSIQINNYSGENVTVDRTQEIISIAVGQSRKAVQGDFARSMSSGQGVYARGIEGNTSARRKAV